MKYFVKMVIAVLLLLIPAAGSQAFQNEPNGFRDMYWGESLQEIQQSRECEYGYYDKTSNSVFYYIELKNNEDHTMSGIPILGNRVKAQLWNNQLTSICISFGSPQKIEIEDAYKNLLNSASINFGTPSISSNGPKTWWGETSYILIFKNNEDFPYTISVIIGSTKLFKMALQDGASQGW
jgi:L-rhamnose mutarotase